MEESITYQEIKGIGQLEEARKIILRQGKKRFGRSVPPVSFHPGRGTPLK